MPLLSTASQKLPRSADFANQLVEELRSTKTGHVNLALMALRLCAHVEQIRDLHGADKKVVALAIAEKVVQILGKEAQVDMSILAEFMDVIMKIHNKFMARNAADKLGALTCCSSCTWWKACWSKCAAEPNLAADVEGAPLTTPPPAGDADRDLEFERGFATDLTDALLNVENAMTVALVMSEVLDMVQKHDELSVAERKSRAMSIIRQVLSRANFTNVTDETVSDFIDVIEDVASGLGMARELTSMCCGGNASSSSSSSSSA